MLANVVAAARKRRRRGARLGHELRERDDAALRRPPVGLRALHRLGGDDGDTSATSSSATSRTSTATGCRSSTPTGATQPPPRTSRSSPGRTTPVKAADPPVEVIGGALSPRGSDRPGRSATRTRRPRSSPTWAPPTARAAGSRRSWTRSRSTPTRTTRASPPRDGTHPDTTTIALADYGKLGRPPRRRRSTGQRRPARHCRSTSTSSASSRRSRRRSSRSTPAPSSPSPSRSTRRQAVCTTGRRSSSPFCYPTVTGLFLFHAVDEKALSGWQSGLYYADDTPKIEPRRRVRLALAGGAPRRRAVPGARPDAEAQGRADGAVLTLRATSTATSSSSSTAAPASCSPPCAAGRWAAGRRGSPVRVPSSAGTYRLRLSAVAPVNRGKPCCSASRWRPG